MFVECESSLWSGTSFSSKILFLSQELKGWIIQMWERKWSFLRSAIPTNFSYNSHHPPLPVHHPPLPVLFRHRQSLLLWTLTATGVHLPNTTKGAIWYTRPLPLFPRDLLPSQKCWNTVFPNLENKWTHPFSFSNSLHPKKCVGEYFLWFSLFQDNLSTHLNSYSQEFSCFVN